MEELMENGHGREFNHLVCGRKEINLDHWELQQGVLNLLPNL